MTERRCSWNSKVSHLAGAAQILCMKHLGVVQAQDKPTWMDGGTLSVAMAAWSNYMSDQSWSKYTENLHPLTGIYEMRKAGRQKVQGSPSTSALCRRWHSSLVICGAAKILTDAGTEGNQRRLNAKALTVMVQSLSKSSFAGFSHPSLWWFLQANTALQKKL